MIELSSGALAYKCLHRSCADNDWKALRRLMEPAYLERAERTDKFASEATAGVDPPPGIDEGGTDLITDLSQIPSVWTLETHLDWCVEGMIARGSVTLICAESGTGKTWVAYYIAGCVARGIAVLGHQVHPCEVLYLDGENPLYVVKQRLFDLGIPETPNLTVWGGWSLSPPVGPHHPLVIEFARRKQGLIIYDSLIEFHSGSEQSSTETRAFMRHFRTLAHLGATVIILGNSGKAETARLYRGSSDIKAAVDTAYALVSATDAPQELGRLSMTCFKGRLAPGQNFGLEFQRGHGFVRCEGFQGTRAITDVVTQILAANPDCNQRKIIEMGRAQGCSKGQLEACLKAGSWRKAKGPNNSTLYNLPPGATGEEQG